MNPFDLVHPVRLEASPAGSLFFAVLRSPGHHETRIYASNLEGLAQLPGVSQAAWWQQGLVYAQGGRLRQWAPNAVVGDLGDASGLVGLVAGHYLISVYKSKVQILSQEGNEDSFPLEGRLLGLPEQSDRGQLALRHVHNAYTSGLMVWRQGVMQSRWLRGGWCVMGAQFVDEERLLVTAMTHDSTHRRVFVLDAVGHEDQLFEEVSPRGYVKLPAARVSPDGRWAAVVRYLAGWPQLVVFDLTSGQSRVVLPGAHEDLAYSEDLAVFSPNSQRIAFSSGVRNLRERHLFVHHLVSQQTAQVSFAPGTASLPAWLQEQLVYLQTGPTEAATLASTAPAVGPIRLNTLGGVDPQPLEIPTLDGDVVRADLYLPPHFDPGKTYPALLYAHGGIFRQMTRGYHPTYTYSLLHAINQRFLKEGYVVLSVDYRGGTGYGLGYEQANFRLAGQVDVQDCADAAQWLANQPYIGRLGVWGVSWGGTMALHLLTKHPHRFAAGVSIAGIWDHAQRARFWEDLNQGEPIYFRSRLGWWERAEGDPAFFHASARNFVEGWKAPLLSFHGTHDESVDYAQQELLERDSQLWQKPLKAITYPGESHVFTGRENWEDTLNEMLRFWDDHLRSV